MKRPYKLLIAAGVLVVLLVGYFIAAHINSKNSQAGEDSDSETITLAELDTDTLTEISYTYDGETITLAKDEEDAWYYTGDTEFPLNTTRVDAMLTALSSVKATRLISENAEEFEEFGLAEPQCVVTVKSADGSSSVFNIGSYNEMLSSYYINIGGTDKAYLTDADMPESFFYDLIGLVEMDSFDSILSSSVTSLTIQSAEDTLCLAYFEEGTPLYYTDSQQWFLSDDGALTAADSTVVSSLLSSISSLSYSGCAAYKINESELGNYGLDDPAYVLTVKYNEEETVTSGEGDDATEETVVHERTFVLRIGDALEDGGYYVMREGADMICTMTSTTLSDIVNAARTDLISDTVFAMDIESVTKAEIKTEAGSVTVTLNEENEHESFTAFFDALTALTTEGKDSGEPTGDPVLQVDFTRNTESFTSMTFTLYEYDSNFYRVVFNGRGDLLIGKRAAENLISLAEAAN